LESQSQRIEGVDALLVQGGEVGADDAKGLGATFSTKAAGDLLFDLGHTHRLLGEVIGKGHAVIGHEAPDIVGMMTQATEQVGGLALLDAPACA